MKSTDLLLQDHKRMVAASDVLTAMAEGAERGQAVSEADLVNLLRFLDEFGDRHHQGVEEGVLFPALLLDPAQKHYQRLHGLVFEHERQRSLIEGLRDSLFTKSTADFIYCARRFSDVVRRHIKEEEETIFPLVASTLSTEEDNRVEQEMKVYDKAWQESELASHLERLSAMELKYLAAERAKAG